MTSGNLKLIVLLIKDLNDLEFGLLTVTSDAFHVDFEIIEIYYV